MAGMLRKRGRNNSTEDGFRERHVLFTKHELSYARVECDKPVCVGECTPVNTLQRHAAATCASRFLRRQQQRLTWSNCSLHVCMTVAMSEVIGVALGHSKSKTLSCAASPARYHSLFSH